MSKLTFRADDELVSRLEAFDTSKSEVLREALREYIERHADTTAGHSADPGVGRQIDEVLAERVDEVLAERVDEVLAERVDSRFAEHTDGVLGGRVEEELAERTHTPASHRERARRAGDINVNVTLDRPDTATASGAGGEGAADVNTAGDVSRTVSNESSHSATGGKTEPDDGESAPREGRSTCTQCGEALPSSHVHCPNCGEKASHRVFCDCGDELRSDWSFCPGCGRRTPAADVLGGS